MEEITIVVVDDHPLLRQGVIDSLMLEPDFKVLADADNGEEGLEKIRFLRPSVAIVDINLPGINGLQVTQKVVSEKLPTQVILLTAYDDGEQRIYAMHVGAAAYCTKDIQPEVLVQMVRDVAYGSYVIGEHEEYSSSADQWSGEPRQRTVPLGSDVIEAYHPLSRREMEVLSYIAQGLSNKEIGSSLRISEQTVKNHVTAIFNKLGVNDRTQAALYALQHGWVRLTK